MKNKLWMILLLVFTILLLIVVVVQLVKHSDDACNYHSPDKSYIRTSPDCIINFMCTKDKVAFRDECGCGCQAISP